MKARTKKTRWLLIALLFGFLAVTGMILTRHHGAATIAQANVATTPMPAVVPDPHALLASPGVKYTFWAPTVARPGSGFTAETYSNSQQPPLTGHSGAPANTSTETASGWSNDGAEPTGSSSNTTQPAGNRPSASAPNTLPQNGAGELAYNGYAPLDCELPAGCGASGGTADLTRQTSGTSGGMPGVHNSGTTTDNSSDPPSTGVKVASAPELDPGTLGGAVTLLLGSLAVLRNRRSRATR